MRRSAWPWKLGPGLGRRRVSDRAVPGDRAERWRFKQQDAEPDGQGLKGVVCATLRDHTAKSDHGLTIASASGMANRVAGQEVNRPGNFWRIRSRKERILGWRYFYSCQRCAIQRCGSRKPGPSRRYPPGRPAENIHRRFPGRGRPRGPRGPCAGGEVPGKQFRTDGPQGFGSGLVHEDLS